MVCAVVRLLLDTHIWIWALSDRDQLVPDVRDCLEDVENELWLSPISIWETLLLAERGRIDLGTADASGIDDMLAVLPVRDAPLTRQVATASRVLRIETQDPADRFIAASARVHGLTLVTADSRLLDADGYDVLANR